MFYGFILSLLNRDRPVRANNLTRTRHAVFPIIAFRYGVPLPHRSVKSNARKSGATIEGPIAYARHAAPDCHASKSGAIIEGILADAHHTVTDCHTRKSGATTEGTIADARHAVGDCHARKPGAITEDMRRNDFYIVPYIYCCKIRTTFEYRRIRCNTCVSGCVPIDCRKPGATIEGAISDAPHSVTDCHARKPGATTEGTFV